MSDEIKPLTKKILESGIIDESMAVLMEKWGALPEGAAALAAGKDIEHATREQLLKLADEVGDEVEKALRLRESMLDLDKLKWPVQVGIYKPNAATEPSVHSGPEVVLNLASEIKLMAVIDRAGRYYFRPSDITEGILVPGRIIVKENSGVFETILEVTELYVGEDIAAIQVSTTRL